VKEMADYKKSDAYKQFMKETSAAKMQRIEQAKQESHTEACNQPTKASTPAPTTTASNELAGLKESAESKPNMTWLQDNNQNQEKEQKVAGFDIPIFTEEFIEHSKQRETEMRQLRRELSELEAQNSVLDKHVESLAQTTTKLDQETEQAKQTNVLLQKNLDLFRQTMLHCFNQVPLPQNSTTATTTGAKVLPSPGNIDEYIARMYDVMNDAGTAGGQQNQQFTTHVKGVFAKINFNSLFESI